MSDSSRTGSAAFFFFFAVLLLGLVFFGSLGWGEAFGIHNLLHSFACTAAFIAITSPTCGFQGTS
eukprot:7829644-Pyramimonas_sp.AAC.1